MDYRYFGTFALAALSCPVLAQNGDGEAAAPVGRPAVARGLAAAPQAQMTAAKSIDTAAAWRVPVHTQQIDPTGGAYGTWAAGLTYKASFHDGFVFYPFLGPDYPENLPFRWTTEAVEVGGQSIVDLSRAPSHEPSDWRYEYRYQGMTERYDVREDGVEQMFVIWQRPAQAGDLVVVGRVGTKLRGPSAGAAHQALTFTDQAGKSLLRYGEAFAIDANGRRTLVKTSFDGEHIRLAVPAADVASAAFPLTIDPLTSRVVIATWGAATFGLASYPEAGRDDESTAANLMVFYSRQFSASDFDGYARLQNDDFTSSALVYTDVTTSWSTVRAGAAFVGAADRWALCLQRDFPATGANTARVRVYFHDKGNTTLNSGVVAFHDPSANECNWYPSVGGTNGFSTSGNNALLVYQADITATQTNTANSKVYSVLVDGVNRSIGTRAELDNSVADDDNELPDVNQESNGGTSSWIVVWQQYNNAIANDDVDLIASRVDSTNVAAGHFFVGPSGGTPTHKLQPQVAGRNGRYCVSMVRSSTRSFGGFGSEVMVERFDWSETAATPTKLGPKTLISDTVSANFVNGGIAHDDNTSSHWALVYQRGGFTTGDCFVIRVGYTGGEVESGTLYNGPNGAWSPNVTFNDDANEFQCVYASNDNPPSGLPVYGQLLQYPTTAVNVLYGTGCGAGTIGAREPNAGYEFFAVQVAGLTAGTPVALLLSTASASISLNVIGATGCFANVDLGAGYVLTINTSAGALVQLPLIDDPVFIGNLYFQGAYPALGLNPANLGATRGLRVQVR